MPPWAARPESGNPGPGGSQGGAINDLDGATATISLATFTANQALGTDGGGGEGGAICNENAAPSRFTGQGVTTTLSQCTFSNNTAQAGSTSLNGGYGGAIQNYEGCQHDHPGLLVYR